MDSYELKNILQKYLTHTNNDIYVSDNIMKFLFICDSCQDINGKKTDNKLFKKSDNFCEDCALEMELKFLLTMDPDKCESPIDIEYYVWHNNDFHNQSVENKKKIIASLRSIVFCFSLASNIQIARLDKLYTIAKKLSGIEECGC